MMLRYIKALLISFCFSSVAFANTTICIHENIKAEVIFLYDKTFIHFVGFDRNLYYPVNIEPIIGDSGDNVIFRYRNKDKNGISVKIADDSTCSITFVANGKSLTYNGMVTQNTIFQ